MDAEQIARRLTEAREAYYNSGTPLMKDSEFDALEEELRNLKPDHPYFQSVGVTTEGKKIRHSIPMLSMGKAKQPEDVWKWVNKLKLPEETPFILEPKIDGLSASCLYREGKLVHVATRGDGQLGQDVSHIAEYIKDIPRNISFSREELEVRGELYLPRNTEYDTQGRPLRNNCVGLINRKEDREDLKHVRFAAYQIIAGDPSTIPPRESMKILTLEKEGFHSVEFQLLQTLEELQKAYVDYLDEGRDRWLYETDGLILMVDDCSLHREIDSRWIVDHHHHYAIALKPPSASRETSLKRVEWQVSRLGSLIPVALFEPVELGGANLERASLHNAQFVKELRLVPGDRLIIERANDVIPYVRANLSREDREAEGFFHPQIPRSCPACQSSLNEEGVHIKCSNPECPERSIQSILYWVRMSGMEQIAEGTIRQLYREKKLRNIRDLYTITEEDLNGLEGFGDKKINNYLQQVARSREMTPRDFISKLGIPLVQKRSLLKLGITSMEDFFQFSDDSYVIGRNIIQWREEPENKALLDTLLSVIDLKEEEAPEEKPELCMTGKGPMGRKELAQLLEDKGYQVVSSVTKNTRILLTDDPSGNSSKLQKARKAGVEILSYEEFLEPLGINE